MLTCSKQIQITVWQRKPENRESLHAVKKSPHAVKKSKPAETQSPPAVEFSQIALK